MTALLEMPIATDAAPSIERRSHPSWKRILDLSVVAMATPILAPLLVAVAVYIRLVSKGPVLFLQSRVGYGGEFFTIYKFRTMHVSSRGRDCGHRSYVAAHAGTGTPVKKPDLRHELIPGGGLIRKLSIDEFPQLINVFLGNMSIVGPRPDLMQLEDYQPWQLERFGVLPGMTGLWQVSGKNELTLEEMIELDIRYARHRSLAGDLKIILKTFVVLIFDFNE
ncbi:sugar transferase [Neorhodopirellula pilleata]|uniref:MurG-like transferase n=1 Tax=Neorhodopirellula pilleata TaxID=2714738 RepID=A0A5C6A254_9BACT|nr:sugar transferase [Neorhodopirellula pilleata]TWT93629.1 MurG-like transferase [Neorhodopirellula pilleata]